MADMSNLTYGRSIEGSNKIVNDLMNDIKEITKALSGAEYANIIKEVRNNWNGTDATAFLKKFEESTKELTQYYNSFTIKIARVIITDYNQFAKQQQQMADTINSSVSKINLQMSFSSSLSEL